MKQNKLLTGSIGISLALHAAFIVLIQTQSLWFYSTATPHKPGAPWAQLLEKTPRDQILEESFSKPFEPIAKNKGQKPQREMEQLASQPTTIPIPEPFLAAHEFPPFPLDNLLASNTELFQIRSFPLPPIQSLDLFADLPKDLILPKKEKKNEPSPLYPLTESIRESQLQHPKTVLPAPPSQSISFSETLSNPAPIDPERALAKSLPTIGVPNLPRLPTLEELGTTSLSDCFESELLFSPREDGPGYIFALTLIPKADLKLPKIRQNVTFLIDRSNSVQKERLHASKQAVQKALEELYSDDSFNIIVFDSKVEKLFASPAPVTDETLTQADHFLDTIQLGSFFSPADPFRPLLLSIPARVRDDELHTAILITDGESLAKKNIQRSLLHQWTEQNDGRVALYTVSMGTDRNLATLDAASVFNRGRLISATTNRGLRRKLLKLMKTIRAPIGKNIAITGISRSPQGQIELFPKPAVAPHLFLDQPYVILGVTETLDDFVLFVQGRLKDQWLNIKKPISFLNGKKGGHTLKMEWALQKAYRKYEQYAIDENPDHLVEARALLEPFDLQTAFQ